MSRSYLHKPVTGIAKARSEKQDKRLAHRSLRAAERVALEVALEEDDAIFPTLREVSDRNSFDKDGKARFDPKVLPHLMRK
jgi:hypothetical protein